SCVLGNLRGTSGYRSATPFRSSAPGLVVTGGALTSLDMTVNGSFTVSSVTITATNLEFSYTAATTTNLSVFKLSGSAGVAISGMGNLSVAFGHGVDATPPTAVP